MSSKFPALEEIDQDLANQENTAGGSADIEDADDFLSREKAALGEDAEAFATDGAPAADDDTSKAAFEASFPSLEQDNAASSLNESGMISQPAEPYLPQQPDLAQETKEKLSLEDSQPIKEWKERRELEIQRRDEASESKRNETREKAKKSIDDFYENYNSKKDDSIEQTRNEEKKFLQERDDNLSATGNTWERIVKLIDTSNIGSKDHDKSRFKDLLLSLKNDSNAPGAAGY